MTGDSAARASLFIVAWTRRGMGGPALALGTAQATTAAAAAAALSTADRGRGRTSLAVPAFPAGPSCLGGWLGAARVPASPAGPACLGGLLGAARDCPPRQRGRGGHGPGGAPTHVLCRLAAHTCTLGSGARHTVAWARTFRQNGRRLTLVGTGTAHDRTSPACPAAPAGPACVGG